VSETTRPIKLDDGKTRVVVLGRLQQRAWTAEDGSPRSTVEVVAEELGPSLRWATATTTKTTRTSSQ
jgi:single-strand DNA-binding protein